MAMARFNTHNQKHGGEALLVTQDVPPNFPMVVEQDVTQARLQVFDNTVTMANSGLNTTPYQWSQITADYSFQLATDAESLLYAKA
jgi:hypothetical protein